MFIECNENPTGRRVGDCTVRAIAKALGVDWDTAYAGLALVGFALCDMPSANRVWGQYLRRNGFRRRFLGENCPECYTVDDFCKDHPKGTFVLAIDGHVITVINGDYYDSWDSGTENPIYYFEKEG